MWNGKKKAVTFSYDDGVEQDRRLIALFNKYGMKATFNQNSGIQTRADMFIQGNIVIHRMNQKDMRELYKGHEIASHTLTHANLKGLDESDTPRSHRKSHPQPVCSSQNGSSSPH